MLDQKHQQWLTGLGVRPEILGLKPVPGSLTPEAKAGAVGKAPGKVTGADSISASVGHGGKNLPEDVAAIQTALNKTASAGLKVDQKCGTKTIGAIKAFQESIGVKADGLIEPGHAAAKALASGTKVTLAKKGAADKSPSKGEPTGAPGAGPGKPVKAAPGQAKSAAPETPAKAAVATPPRPVPKVALKPGGETSQLMSIATSLDSIKPIQGTFPDGPHHSMKLDGKDVEINQQEMEANRKNAQAAFNKAAKMAEARADTAGENYKDYRTTMTTGLFDRAVTFVFDSFTVEDPGDQIRMLVVLAKTQAKVAAASAGGNSYVTAAKALVAADGASHKAGALLRAYKEGLEGSAGTTVTVLEGVKFASEVTLAVGGAVATGGASTVAFAGGLGITAADNLAPALIMGKKVDWGKFAFDIALEIVLKKLGPAEKMEKAVLAKLTTEAAEKVSTKVAKEVFAKIAGVAYENLLKQSLSTAQKMLSGKDLTWEEFSKEVQKDLVKNFAAEVGKALLKK